MSEYWPYMSDENKERNRDMTDKHKFFIDKMNKSKCDNSQILALDTRIPGSTQTLR